MSCPITQRYIGALKYCTAKETDHTIKIFMIILLAYDGYYSLFMKEMNKRMKSSVSIASVESTKSFVMFFFADHLVDHFVTLLRIIKGKNRNVKFSKIFLMK